MPNFVSLLPAAPAMPAANPATSTVTSTSTPGGLLPVELTSPNFLAQFKAALKTIAKVVVQPQLTQRPAADPAAGPLMSPVSDDLSQPELPSAGDADKHAEAILPDLLAELGFAVVPPAFPMPATPTPPQGRAPAPALESAAPLASTPQARLAPVTLQATVAPLPVQAAPAALTPAALAPAALAPASQASLGVPSTQLSQTAAAPQASQPQPAPQLGQALADLHRDQALQDATLAQDPTPGQALPDLYLSQSLLPMVPTPVPVSHQPIEHLKASDQLQPPTPPTAPDLLATVMLPPTPGAHVPTSIAPAATSAPPIGFPQQPSPGGSQAGAQSGNGRSDHGRHTPNKVGPVASEAPTVQAAPVSDTAMAAAVPLSAAPLPVAIGPSQVASQIASHADVIKLPGNRGLRIQLHPDDLGGVQVTVRYSATGGVELHINAEHAATGALVQAGWTELRDALASHGISPDRLVMSVTAPTGAGQADLSGGGGNRSDPNFSSSSQASLSSPDSQSQGQSRQDNPQQRTSPTWSGGLEPVGSTDDNPRVASTTGTPSRIDYRV